MTPKNAFIILFFLLSHVLLFSQECGTIIKNIDLGGDETVWNSSVSKDGFVYISGSLKRPGNISGAFLIKTDTLGNVIWSRVIPGTGVQVFRKVTATTDSGAISVGGSSTYPSNPNFAAIVVKWDKNGNKQWSRSFNTNSTYGDWGLGIIETQDNGFLLVGNQNSAGYQASGCALKMDQAGNALWIKRYAYPEGIDIQGAIEEDDGYILSGEYLFNSNTTYRPLVVKVDKNNGNVLIIKSFSLNGNIISNGDLKKRTGGYFLNGTDLTPISGTGDYQHVVLYLDGNLSVEKAIRLNHALPKNQAQIDLVSLPDGGFVAASGGAKISDDADMYRTNANGDIIWKTRIGGTGAQQLSSSSFLGGNNFVFSGNTATAGGGKDILWLKTSTSTNPNGCNLLASDALAGLTPVSQVTFQFQSVSDFAISNWVIINPAIESDGFSNTYNCGTSCSTLPLLLKDFKAVRKNNQSSLLAFTTLNELNINSIIVERSFNGQSFSRIGHLQPLGGETNFYKFEDNAPIVSTQKISYYRIQILEKDGTISYSTIISLIADQVMGINFSVQPNPSNGNAKLRVLSVHDEGVAVISAYDQLGKSVLKQQIRLLTGENIITVKGFERLSNGLYVVALDFNGGKMIEKILISK